MILTCDDCNTRYVVPSQNIGAEGRRVRCSHCDYEWFQEFVDEGEEDSESESDLPVEDEIEEDDEDQEEVIEPIPDSVKPVPDSSEVPAISGRSHVLSKTQQQFIRGYQAACVVLIIIIAGLGFFKNIIVMTWPFSLALYEFVGLDVTIVGEHLIFENIEAKVMKNSSGTASLYIEANILNLSEKESQIPTIMATLIDIQGNEIEKWLVEIETTSVLPKAQVEISSVYPNISEETKEVNLRFIQGSKVEMLEVKSLKDNFTSEDEVVEKPKDPDEHDPDEHKD